MKRIGILTYVNSVNYGAFLQAFSLWSVISERYKDKVEVEIINYDSRKSHDIYKSGNSREIKGERYQRFEEEKKTLPLSKNQLISDSISDISEFIKSFEYDVIVVGSDEVWKTDGMRGFPNAYWLNFDIGKTIRLAYAVSGRNDYQKLNEEEKKYICESINKFEYIGVRDSITKRELENILNVEIKENCDPTLLWEEFYQLSRSDIANVKTKRGIATDRRIVVLILSNVELERYLYEKLSLEEFVISTNATGENTTDYPCYAQSPIEWQELIAISDLVITDRFHGTVFSLIHDRPFVSIEHEPEGRGKIENILNGTDFEDCYIHSNRSIEDLQEAVISKAQEILDGEKWISSKTLIENEKKSADTFFSVLDEIVG